MHTNQQDTNPLVRFDNLNEYMAEMEVDLTYIYLHLGDEDEWENCIAKTKRLIVYLQDSKRFIPKSIQELPENERHQKHALYIRFADKTICLLQQLYLSLVEKETKVSEEILNAIDQSRRDCHVAFG